MSEYKLVPIKSTEEMIEAARSARPYIDDDEDELKDRNSEMTWDAMVAAAPAQEVEPVVLVKDMHYTGQYSIGRWDSKEQWYLMDDGDCYSREQLIAEYEPEFFYLSPITAEQAAADMKRRCIDALEDYLCAKPTTELGRVTVRECLALVESLPTSDTANSQTEPKDTGSEKQEAMNADWSDIKLGGVD